MRVSPERSAAAGYTIRRGGLKGVVRKTAVVARQRSGGASIAQGEAGYIQQPDVGRANARAVHPGRALLIRYVPCADAIDVEDAIAPAPVFALVAQRGDDGLPNDLTALGRRKGSSERLLPGGDRGANLRDAGWAATGAALRAEGNVHREVDEKSKVESCCLRLGIGNDGIQPPQGRPQPGAVTERKVLIGLADVLLGAQAGKSVFPLLAPIGIDKGGTNEVPGIRVGGRE